jgi:hypothetical protein
MVWPAMKLKFAVDIMKTKVRLSAMMVSLKFQVDPEVEKSIQFAKIVENVRVSATTFHEIHF